MPNITSLHPKASEILDTFFTKIQGITLSDFSQHQQLLKRTKQLFSDLDRLGAEEFSEIFKYNYFHSSIEEVNKKYHEVLLYLVTCVIERYSESDLLRYFLPQDLSQQENRPEYSDHTSRLGHWFQLIGYWFRQLLNKPIYKLNPENSLLTDSVKYIKASLHKRSYVENSVDVDLRTHLSKVLIQLEKRLINSQLEDLASQGIIERERIVARREEEVSKQERLFSEKLEGLTKSEEILRERSKLLTDDRQEIEKQKKDLEKENEKLKEKISNLNEGKKNETFYRHFLEDKNYQLEKGLEELAKEWDVFPPASQNIQAHAETLDNGVENLSAIPSSNNIKQSTSINNLNLLVFNSFLLFKHLFISASQNGNIALNNNQSTSKHNLLNLGIFKQSTTPPMAIEGLPNEEARNDHHEPVGTPIHSQ